MDWISYSDVAEFKILPPRPQLCPHFPPFYVSTYGNAKVGAKFYRIERGFLLRFPDLADFEVSAGGRQVVCFPAPHVQDSTPEHLYLNQVLPLVLSKAGKFAFHASAVEVAEGAVAFAAESGRGKSTLAAYFGANGYRLLTDDALFLEPRDQGFQVIPSHPSIRLLEDSAGMLVAMNAVKAPPLHFTTKTRFLAGRGFDYCVQPRPLRAVYFLGEGSAEDIIFRRLSTTETLMEWVKNSFLLDVEDKSMITSHFDRLTALAGTLICYHLDYPRRFGDLKCLLQAILDHLALQRFAA